MPSGIRDHQPIVIDQFNGYWNRGDPENTPLDHFSDANNLRYFGTNSFGSRFGVGPFQNGPNPLASILRMYNYPTATQQTLLVLTIGGQIYHIVDSATIFGPILTIPTMTDFAFVPYAGRAYISPFTTEVAGTSGMNIERGLINNFLYVYKGDGTPARPAGGNPAPNHPSGIFMLNGTAPGFPVTDTGIHIFGQVFETDTGYLTAPGNIPTAFAETLDGNHLLNFINIVNSVDSFVVKKHIVATKAIVNFNGDTQGYQFFFIPGATINDNVTTTLNDVSFFDADLVDDASHLIDNFSQPPAGVKLFTYHNRLVSLAEHDNISVARVSTIGEPEAFNQITGLLLVPPDGNPLTNGAELRDVLFLTKRNKTFAFVDNGDDPTTWQLSVIDTGMGTGVHGIATNLDSGSTNIDYLIIGTYKGITLFNGRYILPELSWKVQAYWLAQNFKQNNRFIQMVNDSVAQALYCVTTDRTILYANYANGFDPKKIRWNPWTFQPFVNTLCLINVNDLLLGCDQV
jgi:hypothetical protein